MSHTFTFLIGATTGLTGALWLAAGKVMLLALGQPGDAAAALLLSLAALALVIWLNLSRFARDAVVLSCLAAGAFALSLNMGILTP
jgi:hypothetical protein